MAQALFSANSDYRIDVDAALVSQDIAANTSYIYWRTQVIKTAGSGRFSGGPDYAWADSNNGDLYDLWNEGGFGHDFRNGSTSGVFQFKEGYFTVAHNADGTGSYFVTSSMTLVDIGGATAGTGWRDLPRIPRGPRVKDGGVYKNTIAYVKDAGAYKIAIPYVKNAGAYAIGGG